ncbi:MAG: YafY family transcriptional regulator [Rhodobacteraceae bacterium]|nr:YafY family transcriptional regulator [Paracoccaceae bacterium]
MRRAERLFEIIQILRQKERAVTAAELAEILEVTPRTVYRDIAALQARRTPIDGEVGVGYILRKSYDLPPLNFDTEEIEAIVVGLSLLRRTGDAGLQRAASRVANKIEAIDDAPTRFVVSSYGVEAEGGGLLSELRDAIRNSQALEVTYLSLDEASSTRSILPLALAYFAEVNLLAAWCELRQDFRHFRVDRIQSITPLARFFADESARLRTDWAAENYFANI